MCLVGSSLQLVALLILPVEFVVCLPIYVFAVMVSLFDAVEARTTFVFIFTGDNFWLFLWFPSNL